jgi:hypothetical protein
MAVFGFVQCVAAGNPALGCGTPLLNGDPIEAALARCVGGSLAGGVGAGCAGACGAGVVLDAGAADH